MGLGENVLRAARPDLIIARISAYGQDGPDRDKAAFGVIGEAIGGLRHLTNHAPGTTDLPPVRVGVSIGDSVAGIYAALGAVAALLRRERTGAGGEVVASLPAGVRLRLNLATSFDYPFDGRMEENLVLFRLAALLAHREDVEVGLCDTTGRADPEHVFSLSTKCLSRFGERTRWVFHGHDTYGHGLANVAAAWRAGITGFDAAFGGLGGCPFAPGATGNVATEDVAWMFRRMGVEPGVDLAALVALANRAAALPGASPGGRVRAALVGTCAA